MPFDLQNWTMSSCTQDLGRVKYGQPRDTACRCYQRNVRVKLNLVSGWHNSGKLQQLLQKLDGKVGNTDSLDLFGVRFVKALHGLPSISPVPVFVRTSALLHRRRPVHQPLQKRSLESSTIQGTRKKKATYRGLGTLSPNSRESLSGRRQPYDDRSC